MSLCPRLKTMMIVSLVGVPIGCGKDKSNSSRAPDLQHEGDTSTQKIEKENADAPAKKSKNDSSSDPNDHTLTLSASDSDFYIATIGSLKIKFPTKMKTIMLESSNGDGNYLCSSDSFYIENADKDIPQKTVTADLMISHFACAADQRQQDLEKNLSGPGKAVSIKTVSDGFTYQGENQSRSSRNFHGGLVIRSLNDCYSYSMAVFDMGSTSPVAVRNVVAFLRDRLDQAFISLQ